MNENHVYAFLVILSPMKSQRPQYKRPRGVVRCVYSFTTRSGSRWRDFSSFQKRRPLDVTLTECFFTGKFCRTRLCSFDSISTSGTICGFRLDLTFLGFCGLRNALRKVFFFFFKPVTLEILTRRNILFFKKLLVLRQTQAIPRTKRNNGIIFLTVSR